MGWRVDRQYCCNWPSCTSLPSKRFVKWHGLHHGRFTFGLPVIVYFDLVFSGFIRGCLLPYPVVTPKQVRPISPHVAKQLHAQTSFSYTWAHVLYDFFN